MVNIEKYRNDGWGLSKREFIDIETILNKIEKPIILEFGSGLSTEFCVDYLNEYNKEGKIYSFDDSYDYCSKVVDPKLTLKVKRLVECSDDDFDSMFRNKKYDSSLMKFRMVASTTRQKNCFYDILPDEIPNNPDLVIIDGPHGNGRSFSFLHLIGKLNKGAFILIDDYNHYDFVDRLKMLFPNVELFSESATGSINQWELGGNYVIYKVL